MSNAISKQTSLSQAVDVTFERIGFRLSHCTGWVQFVIVLVAILFWLVCSHN